MAVIVTGRAGLGSKLHGAANCEGQHMWFPPVETHEVCIVMPAYQAADTIARTLARLPEGSFQHLIVVDDAGTDDLASVIDRLNESGWEIDYYRHATNRGYGANQKTCYEKALATGAETVVMVHPDGQYDPALVPHLVGFIQASVVDIVLGSRILRRSDVLEGGMPPVKYLVNRLLTFVQNIVLGYNLPEYHTGYRAYRREVLEQLNYEVFSDDFVFDQELIAAARVHDFRVGAVPVPTRYAEETSSIGLGSGAVYALRTLRVLVLSLIERAGIWSFELFAPRDG